MMQEKYTRKDRMMRAFFLFSLFSLSLFGEIQWQSRYEEAVKASKTSSKPLLVFFTGSDWCLWCEKLEKEVFKTKEFEKAAGDRFIFLKADFPNKAPQEKAVKEQNTLLLKKFDIHSYPTVILLDSQEKIIGLTGYRKGGGKAYAEHLLAMIHDYVSYISDVEKISKGSLGEEKLEELYKKALAYERQEEAQTILRAGCETKKPLFFLIERYRLLSKEGLQGNEEALFLRKKLLEVGKENEQRIHNQLALIDFMVLAQSDKPLEAQIEPLKAYLARFETNDGERWRFEFLIAQVYMQKGELDKAREYALKALSSAPESAKDEISLALEKIQAQLP